MDGFRDFRRFGFMLGFAGFEVGGLKVFSFVCSWVRLCRTE